MIVVTGASGHSGVNLVRALLAQGRSIRALVHLDRSSVEGLDVEAIQGNICDLESLVKAFKNTEVVYHLAAYISISSDEWPLLEAVNVIGTRNVVEACLRCGVRRLVHRSLRVSRLVNQTPWLNPGATRLTTAPKQPPRRRYAKG
jgi:dihydroflavonol-4-reductase